VLVVALVWVLVTDTLVPNRVLVVVVYCPVLLVALADLLGAKAERLERLVQMDILLTRQQVAVVAVAGGQRVEIHRKAIPLAVLVKSVLVELAVRLLQERLEH
tara:strand:- start:80 stop:388 length:309 start_codon:yes stop_codon:yes gene_type:complete